MHALIAHAMVSDPFVVELAWTISGTVTRVRENTRLEVAIAGG
jgi:hypothetical protein